MAAPYLRCGREASASRGEEWLKLPAGVIDKTNCEAATPCAELMVNKKPIRNNHPRLSFHICKMGTRIDFMCLKTVG